LKPTGPAVGLFPDVEYSIGQTYLAPGDALLAYTDGVIDALSPQKERFEEERLLSLFDQPSDSAQALLDRVWTDVETHTGGGSPFDDITLLSLRRRFSIL
jgi:sigma-B regulation protein RsbU (phosphoserine phosphatase)